MVPSLEMLCRVIPDCSLFPQCFIRRLDEVLTPEVCPQVNNLPRTQTHQQAHSTQCKPFDSLVRALIRISQLLLACPQIIHLGDNLAHGLLDPAQLRLDGLELVASRNGVPVLGIGSYVDVEFDVARDAGAGGARVCVLKAHVKGRVGVRGESVAVFADDILGTVVVVAHCVADLRRGVSKCDGAQWTWCWCRVLLLQLRRSRMNVHACQPSGHLLCIHLGSR
jgi:hypothetical protein